MIADCYKITTFGLIKPGEEIPEEKLIEVESDSEGAAENADPVETPKPDKRRKK